MDDPSGMPPVFGIFFVIFALMVVAGIGTTIWRISAARRIARNAGLDPNDATAVALLDEDGLAATYLGAGMRARRRMPEAELPVQERLAVLDDLRESGKVTEDEYQASRARILGSI